ncbi:hypothetical protein BCT30_01300 [Enterovibrio norvegicus]|uniref:hypothetical protein n=1 Tax=Enterovibrio norvegicus TaxID=188144 RepID=UPI0003049276|nr:hypothetical protein [Enterovibrio norvegicus]MCC4798070.1 hypothetical protein [Enterovibrio norvegicus]OEE49969.1 hypothetical protein A1OS_23450 [Enterovibrio norvegicus]PMH72074.1 hypothetical protein BCU62_03365 [Enterovibrio norvegicus]PMI32341.1 hypothetical protein BCU47_01650 [Enterovibrio norvegicus]PMI38083.1 hypothetical protein BCU46_09565 [Enterovibrio norvegicus]
MNKHLTVIALITLLTACGGGGDGGDVASVTASDTGTANDSGSASTTSSAPSMLVDTSGGVADIPETITSSATSMSETVVPDDFSYNPVLEQNFEVDIRGYSVSPAYISLYGEFTENDDGTFTANYNSRITSAPVEDGEATLDYVSSDSQYYVLAEVWYYDGTSPVQKRIPNTESSWVW